MSHHHPPPAFSVPRLLEPTLTDRLWGIQEHLHDVARRLGQPGPHGAESVADLYDLLGALKVAVGDVHYIIARATRLLCQASDHKLTSRPCGDHESVWLLASQITAHHLTRTLEHAQTAISDIAGHLHNPTDPAGSAPPASPPSN